VSQVEILKPGAPALPERFLGRVGGPGLRLLVLGALHGNEPDGVIALQSVLTAVEQRGLALRGSVTGLLGNRRAYNRGLRYLERDLNRGWGDSSEPEDETALERRELSAAIELEVQAAKDAGERILVLDLHSTSGPGAPFAIPPPGGAQGLIEEALDASGLPQVAGLAERIDSALLSWLQLRGVDCLVMEGGQADRPETSLNLEAALWRVLGALLGLPEAQQVSVEAEEQLVRATDGLPAHLEVSYVHETTANSQFIMDRPQGRPFAGFQAVAEGELLAQDVGGPITAPFDGYLLMPLYQGQGGEGFFLARGI
jgi:succinylglutamate desuccinylase